MYTKWISIYLLLGFSLSTHAQSSTTDFWTCVQDYYGTDHRLVNGKTYTRARPRAKGHPYFLTDQWTNGDLYWHGRHFPQVALKYDVIEQQLILQHNLQDGLPVKIILAEEFVDSFRIENHLFIRKNQLPTLAEASGYIEQVYTGKLAAYRNYEKVFIANYNGQHPHGKYSSPQQQFFLLQQSTLHKINNQRSFTAFFGAKKKEVKKYLRQQKIRLKEASPAVLSDLMKYCNEAI